ncbi:hypothetical protein [Lentilactobacillus hilgardii]|uniref:hypothetical protein n=1 Tax=Lentilactobacillus hilgardii TaxID=1588 RepID=UPI0021A75816|nr:hypothetical protein [Lentilactobacillus hilgardii]MCT3395124.1 hypothetical protein [Lentilactobacillus hilgardii]
MTIWNDHRFFLLIGITVVGFILWGLLKRVSYFNHQILYYFLIIVLALIGLLSNGLGVYFLIQPFYGLVISIIISILAIIIGIFYLFSVFIFSQRKK